VVRSAVPGFWLLAFWPCLLSAVRCCGLWFLVPGVLLALRFIGAAFRCFVVLRFFVLSGV
jgi:hypothetical protein